MVIKVFVDSAGMYSAEVTIDGKPPSKVDPRKTPKSLADHTGRTVQKLINEDFGGP
ncbi:MAG: hypothetical protein QOJ97_2457 [Solirubrobacteraceae bacterium]|nr:hypothetical protein [Solirubrobacteraceae bacterium]